MPSSLLPREERQLPPTHKLAAVGRCKQCCPAAEGKTSCGKKALGWDLGKYKAIDANYRALRALIGLNGPTQPYLGPPITYPVAFMKALPVPA